MLNFIHSSGSIDESQCKLSVCDLAEFQLYRQFVLDKVLCRGYDDTKRYLQAHQQFVTFHLLWCKSMLVEIPERNEHPVKLLTVVYHMTVSLGSHTQRLICWVLIAFFYPCKSSYRIAQPILCLRAAACCIYSMLGQNTQAQLKKACLFCRLVLRPAQKLTLKLPEQMATKVTWPHLISVMSSFPLAT